VKVLKIVAEEALEVDMTMQQAQASERRTADSANTTWAIHLVRENLAR
jgi:hypothetical protein